MPDSGLPNVGQQLRGFTFYGTKMPDGTVAGFTDYGRVPEPYLVTIVSSKVGIVRAVMQDNLKLGVASEWKSFMGDSINGAAAEVLDKVNTLAQVFGKSLQNVLTSRRMWKSTNPVAITMDLIFLADRNARDEVVKPCAMLQAMVLPLETTAGFLLPPGPSPFVYKNIDFTNNTGDIIAIYLGTFVGFRNVIVKSCDVVYDTKYDTNGFPISAKATITFETYEILTKDKLGSVYKMVDDLREKVTTDMEERKKYAGI